MHPNFYRNGKVCLSLINTWKGDQWTGCNTISSLLNTIATRFTKNALLHEPGVNLIRNKKEVADYDTCIEFQNLNTAILNIVLKKKSQNYFNGLDKIFENEIKNNFKINFEKIKEKIEGKKNKIFEIYVSKYNMSETINYGNLQNEITKIKN